MGLDSRAYLASFTTKGATLAAQDVPRDYRTLVDFARRGRVSRPVLVGVSEGAGLSVLAATDAETRARVQGVVALGLPDRNELGWRFRDSIIYLTKKVPDEPAFSVAEVIKRVSPLPLAGIHSTRDEFVPIGEAERLFAIADDPKRLWIVDAADHRFSNNMGGLEARLTEALEWIRSRAIVLEPEPAGGTSR